MRLLVQRPVFSEMRNPGGPPKAYEYRVVVIDEHHGGEGHDRVTLTPDEHVVAVLP